MSDPDGGMCGYRLDIGLDDEAIPAEPCERPTWTDHDRCVWHAPVDGKTADELESARPGAGENVDGAYLVDASLVSVDWLAGASLVGADLRAAKLNSADLSGVDLTLATVTNVSAIGTDFTGANLEGAIFTDADLRRSTLEDARIDEVVFTDIHIDARTTFGEESIYDREAAEPAPSRDHSLEAAAWAYRQLQQVYRDNALPRLARRSYTQEKDARRRLAWDRRDYRNVVKLEVSRLVMLYGSSPYRVLAFSFLVILVCAVLYPLTGGIQDTAGDQAITYTLENPEDAPPWWIAEVLIKSLYFSVVTFATLGYGDIQPIGTWARALASVETVIGSLLSAMLVFVLTRLVTW